MSLINDALRRADQAKKQQTPDAAGGAPMQQVHPHPQTSKMAVFGPLALIVLLAVVLSLASWFFWKSWQTKSRPHAIAQVETPVAVVETKSAPNIPAPTALTPTEEVKPVAVAPPVVEKISPPPPSAPPVVAAEPAPVVEPAVTAPAPVTPAAPAAPELNLQGIFYRIKNPTAMINGKPVSVGESVSGARVLKIERQAVTVEWSGQTNVLTLE